MNDPIEIKVSIACSVEELWPLLAEPKHIQAWNFAHESWHCPRAVNELREGEAFNWRMEARDGSMGFDFRGRYLEVIPFQLIRYQLDDGRLVTQEWHSQNGHTELRQSFEPDGQIPPDQQRQGWQAILNNLKHYAENRP